MDTSQKVEPLKVQLKKKVHLWAPITRLLPLVDIQLSIDDRSSLGKLHEHMHLYGQAIMYPLSLHISRATDIKMVADRVCPHLPVWDAAKKQGFELYYKAQMPYRHMKVEIVNHPRNWSSLFHR